MDAGDVLLKLETEIGPEDTTGKLTERLAHLGAKALLEGLERVEEGRAVFEPQDESKVSFAPKITKKDARIDWERDAVYLGRFIRAMTPDPGAYTFISRRGQNMRLNVTGAGIAEGSGTPGTVLKASEGHLIIAAGLEKPSPIGRKALEITELRPEGKKTMSAEEFLRGYSVGPGNILG